MMDELIAGIIIGLWIGLYLIARLNQKPRQQYKFKKQSNRELVQDLSKISNSFNNCIELITCLDQQESNITSKKKVYYDELITQDMLKLDQISNPKLKPIRRETIRCLQQTLDLLD